MNSNDNLCDQLFKLDPDDNNVTELCELDALNDFLPTVVTRIVFEYMIDKKRFIGKLSHSSEYKYDVSGSTKIMAFNRNNSTCVFLCEPNSGYFVIVTFLNEKTQVDKINFEEARSLTNISNVEVFRDELFIFADVRTTNVLTIKTRKWFVFNLDTFACVRTFSFVNNYRTSIFLKLCSFSNKPHSDELYMALIKTYANKIMLHDVNDISVVRKYDDILEKRELEISSKISSIKNMQCENIAYHNECIYSLFRLTPRKYAVHIFNKDDGALLGPSGESTCKLLELDVNIGNESYHCYDISNFSVSDKNIFVVTHLYPDQLLTVLGTICVLNIFDHQGVVLHQSMISDHYGVSRHVSTENGMVCILHNGRINVYK